MASKGNAFWPDVSTLEGTQLATKQGIWAAAFVSVVTGAVASAALFLHKPILGINGSALIDTAIFAAVAFGIHKNSRFAAAGGLVIYLWERFYMLKAGGSGGGGSSVMTIFLVLAFVTAVRGTFAYRKLASSTNSPRPISG